jgi:hypothetical protein
MSNLVKKSFQQYRFLSFVLSESEYFLKEVVKDNRLSVLVKESLII